MKARHVMLYAKGSFGLGDCQVKQFERQNDWMAL